MKYILSVIGVITIVCGIFFCGGWNKNNERVDEDFMRIHITANSNSSTDQNVKYQIKDVVVDYLIPLLAEVENKEEACQMVEQNLWNIKLLIDESLKLLGMDYVSEISIEEEFMPTRAYDNLVLEEGVYESLKIDLGQGEGDNWWCVVFPAVCFLSSKNYENLEYISKIWEMINNVTR